MNLARLWKLQPLYDKLPPYPTSPQHMTESYFLKITDLFPPVSVTLKYNNPRYPQILQADLCCSILYLIPIFTILIMCSQFVIIRCTVFLPMSMLYYVLCFYVSQCFAYHWFMCIRTHCLNKCALQMFILFIIPVNIYTSINQPRCMIVYGGLS